MARDNPTFECTACGQTSSKWLGRCPACGGWNTFEQVPETVRTRPPGRAAPEPVPLSSARTTDTPRVATGIAGLDRVLGGGLVPGSVVLLAGEPGIGKSTLLLQAAAATAAAGPVLYLSAEESTPQVTLRAQRLGCTHDRVFLLTASVVEEALAAARRVTPVLMIVDSVQAMLSERVPAVAGSVTQVREVAAQLLEHAKSGGPAVILVGHVTKEGLVAGPKALEHLVDAVLDFSGGGSHPHRILRASKNRFGPASELALFAMGDNGLTEVADPSQALLADRKAGAPGSAVAVVMEGLTPLLVEVQALVSRSALANPRRVAQGLDGGRLALLLAVLEKRAGARLADRDVFANVVGGLTIDEPAFDLALAAAVLSSAAERPLAPDLALFGEVGLLGEIRAVNHPQERMRAAHATGFRRCAVPASSKLSPLKGISSVPLADVSGLKTLFDAST